MLLSKLLQMALVLLTTSSTSPWTVPGDLKVAGHTVVLLGSGGNGAAATTGTTSVAGGGGGGGACTSCVYSSGTVTPGSTTIPFLINAGGSANATQWQSSTAGTGAYYEALPGGNAAGATAGAASGATTTVGTPTITYTATNHTGAAGGAGGGSNTLGGGGGGGSGGITANGGGGGTSTSTGGSGGGGGGAANAGANATTTTGGTGGNGNSGSGGTAGNDGTGSSGGGGGNGGQNTTTGNGGSGGNLSVTNPLVGYGGGGGGGGGDTVNQATNSKGGNGGLYGGGGGGQGCVRGSTTGTFGSGAAAAIVIIYASTAHGFDQQGSDEAQPLVRRPLGRQSAAGLMRADVHFVNFPTWRNAGWEIQPPQPPSPNSLGRTQRTQGALRHKSGFDWFVWTDYGWPIQPPQPPHPIPERRAGGIMRGDEGNQATQINFFPHGWPIQPWQPPHRRPERGAGMGLEGDDGNAGIATTLPQPPPPHIDPQYNTYKRPLRSYGALRHKPGFAWFAWVNIGYEQVYTQPLHRRYNSPDIGDPLIEGPFVPPVVTVTWGFEQTPTGFKRSPYTKPSILDIGDPLIEGPFVQWINQGYEQVYTQPRFRLYKSPDIGDPLIEGAFVQWRNFGWEVQPPPPPHRWYKSPDVGNPGGIDRPFSQWVNQGYEQVYTQPPHKWFKSPDIGDPLIEGPFVRWINDGWEQVASQDKHRWYKSPEFGDQGIEAQFVPFVVTVTWGFDPQRDPFKQPRRTAASISHRSGAAFFAPWVNQGYEQVYAQPLHRFFKSPDTGDQGIENVFTFVPPGFVPWQFDLQPWQPQHRWFKSPDIGDQGIQRPFAQWFNQGWDQVAALTRFRLYKSPDVGNPGGIDARYVNWINVGFDQVYSQPLHRFFKSPDAGDGGIEFPFVFTPTNFMGWDVQSPVVRHYWNKGPGIDGLSQFLPSFLLPMGWETPWLPVRYRGYKSPDVGDGGIEAPFIFTPPGFVAWAWEQSATQPKALRRTAPSISHRTGAAFFAPWVNQGFDQVYSQPLHRYFKSPDTGDQGIQNTFSFVPPGFVSWAWDPQPWQPRYKWNKSPDVGDQGIQSPFAQWFNQGWAQTEALSRYRLYKSPTTGDAGIAGQFVQWINDGWEQTDALTRRRWWLHSPEFGDQGNEAPFNFWRNFGWEVQPPQPPSSALIHARMGAGLMRGDDGAQNTLINFYNFGWAIQPWQPPNAILIHAKGAAFMIGDDSIYAPFNFVPPPAVTGLFMPGLFGATTHVGRAGYTPEPNP